MKANISRARYYPPVIKYVADREKNNAGNRHSEFICGTILDSSIKDMCEGFRIPLKVKKVSKPVYHISLSMPKGEPKRSREEWQRIIEGFLRHMGIPSDCPYCAYRHSDTGCDHVHIVCSRVALNGTVYAGKFDILRAIEATQQLEQVFDLTRTKGLGSERNHFPRNEQKMIERTQELSEKQKIKILVANTLKVSSTFEEFALSLKNQGIGVHLNVARNGHISGISFSKDGFAVKGSSLGSGFSINRIMAKLPSLSGVMPERSREQNIRVRERTR